MAAERAQIIDRFVAVEGRLLATESKMSETAAKLTKMSETMIGLGDQLQQVTMVSIQLNMTSSIIQ